MSDTLPADPAALQKLYEEMVQNLPPNPADNKHKAQTLYEIICSYPDTSTLAHMIRQSPKTVALLNDPANGEYTVFAPMNSEDLSGLASTDTSKLEELLSLHVSPHYVPINGLLHMPNVPTNLRYESLNGPVVLCTRSDSSGWHINSSIQLHKGDILARNGCLHLIRQPCSPPGDLLSILQQRSDLSVFCAALEMLGDNTISPSSSQTIFAPNDAAFEALGKQNPEFSPDCDSGKRNIAALVKAHICPGVTFLSNFMWPKNDGTGRMTSSDEPRDIHGSRTVELDTLDVGSGGLATKVAVSFARHNSLVAITLNGSVRVVEKDFVARNGSLHICSAVLYLPQGQA